MVVWRGFAVPMHIRSLSLLFHCPDKNHTSIDSLKKELYNDTNDVNVDNKIVVYIKINLKIGMFKSYF